MECIRRLLRRSGEALRLLQLLQQHHVGRLAQGLDPGQRRQLAQLTFHQLVCSGEGEQIATRLVAALMEVLEMCVCGGDSCVLWFAVYVRGPWRVVTVCLRSEYVVEVRSSRL